MSVEFHEEEIAYARRPEEKKPSLFTRLIFKLKLADSPENAQRIILIAALLCLGASALLLLNLAGVF